MFLQFMFTFIYFYLLYFYVRGLGIDIVAIYMYCGVYICPIITTTFIVFSASVSRLLNLSEAEQLVVRCGEWNTQHENEPLAHQVLELYSLITQYQDPGTWTVFSYCKPSTKN